MFARTAALLLTTPNPLPLGVRRTNEVISVSVRAADYASSPRQSLATVYGPKLEKVGVGLRAPSFPPESFAGCRTAADRILRAHQLLREREAIDLKRGSQRRCYLSFPGSL